MSIVPLWFVSIFSKSRRKPKGARLFFSRRWSLSLSLSRDAFVSARGRRAARVALGHLQGRHDHHERRLAPRRLAVESPLVPPGEHGRPNRVDRRADLALARAVLALAALLPPRRLAGRGLGAAALGGRAFVDDVRPGRAVRRLVLEERVPRQGRARRLGLGRRDLVGLELGRRLVGRRGRDLTHDGSRGIGQRRRGMRGCTVS